MFGELGILMGKARSASAIAAERVDVGVLNAQTYKSLLMKVELRKMEDRIEFFTGNFFHNMPRNVIMKYCYNFEKSKLRKDQVVYKQGDKPLSVYLIKKGEVKVRSGYDLE